MEKVWENTGSVEPMIGGMVICSPCADKPSTEDDPHPRGVKGWISRNRKNVDTCDCCGK